MNNRVTKHREIFGGDYSAEMWGEINAISGSDLQRIHGALYTMGCRLQEYESQVNARLDKLERTTK